MLGHKKEWTFFRGGETNSSSFILYTQIQKSKSIYVSELLRDERRPPQWCACTVTTAFKNSNMNIYIYLLVWFKNNQGVNADLRKISVESDMRKNHDIYLIEAVCYVAKISSQYIFKTQIDPNRLFQMKSFLNQTWRFWRVAITVLSCSTYIYFIPLLAGEFLLKRIPTWFISHFCRHHHFCSVLTKEYSEEVLSRNKKLLAKQ